MGWHSGRSFDCEPGDPSLIPSYTRDMCGHAPDVVHLGKALYMTFLTPPRCEWVLNFDRLGTVKNELKWKTVEEGPTIPLVERDGSGYVLTSDVASLLRDVDSETDITVHTQGSVSRGNAQGAELPTAPHDAMLECVQGQENSSEGESLSIGTIHMDEVRSNEDEAYTTMQITKKTGRKKLNINLRLKIDTGAQSNVLPLEHYKKMFPENMTRHKKVKAGMLTPSQVILTAYGGTRIPHLGKTTITGKHGGKEVKCSFYVTTTQGPAIIGLSTCQKWKIISINHEVKTSSHKIEAAMPLKDRPPIHSKKELMEMYPECFDDNVGCFKGEYHITIDPDVKPVVHPPRRVPLELRGRLKAQLEVDAKLTEAFQSLPVRIKEKNHQNLDLSTMLHVLQDEANRDHTAEDFSISSCHMGYRAIYSAWDCGIQAGGCADFVNVLAKVLTEHGNSQDLMRMMATVIDEQNKEHEHSPFCCTTLRHKLLFHPIFYPYHPIQPLVLGSQSPSFG
ncbi:hypothetical protein Bbelb_110060 [Branchiostoma belcheri]|nr:hypothetical protein Bbelb_110060 [Branchiostoma belcheri]